MTEHKDRHRDWQATNRVSIFDAQSTVKVVKCLEPFSGPFV